MMMHDDDVASSWTFYRILWYFKRNFDLPLTGDALGTKATFEV
jgi:hypothetical protein